MKGCGFINAICFLPESSILKETNSPRKLLIYQIAFMMKGILIEHPASVKSRKSKHPNCNENHDERLRGMRDAVEVLSGKWKVQLIGTLLFGGRMRFMDLLREVEGIGAKMLSKELQDLESHQLITRTVMQTKPITVEYEITAYGKSLEQVIIEIAHWGMQHRKKIMKSENPSEQVAGVSSTN